MLIDLELNLSVAGTGGFVNMGICMIDEDAAAAGALPDANSDNEQPGWMWRTTQTVFTAVVNDRASATLVKADIRAMRKFAGDNVQLRWIANNSASGNPINVNGIIRVLLMKH